MDEDYLIQSENFKQLGNESFAKGDQESLLLAIKYYSDAIDIDPDNHVLYSNRSAAYLKADFKSKSLYDAEKCIKLNDKFIKGYSRLGAAQQSLKRFPDAIDTFKKGISIAGNNNCDALFASLNACQAAYEADKKYKREVAEYERKMELEKQAHREKNLSQNTNSNSNVSTDNCANTTESAAAGATEQDIMAGFFADVNGLPTKNRATGNDTNPAASQPNPEIADDVLTDFFSSISENAAPKPKPKQSEEGRDETVLTQKYMDQDLGTVAFQMDRLLQTNYEFKNLNPYYVLDLGDDATIEDIKNRYRKLSSKVHPDKVRVNILKDQKIQENANGQTVNNCIPNAEPVDVEALTERAMEAFEQVKNAYNKLMDPGTKKSVLMSVNHIKEVVLKDRKNGKGLHLSEEDDIRKQTMKYFAEIEMKKRASEKNLRAHSARDKKIEAEEKAKAELARKFDENWKDSSRVEKRISNWRDFQGDPQSKKVKLSHFKEETADGGKKDVPQRVHTTVSHTD